MLPIRTILHPTDLSAESAGAFRLACALARNYSARLVLLSVYPPPFNGAEAVDRTRPDGIEDDLLAKLAELKPDGPTVRVECRAEEGRPADAILGVANQIGADLIVMGTHGRGGAARVLMGSVAEAVNRGATCPVLTVRQKLQPVADRAAPSQGEGGNVADAEAGPEDWRTVPDPADDPSRDVDIPAGTVTLQGTLWWPRNPRGVVVFAHGLGSTRYNPGNRAIAAHLTGAGYATLVMDLLPGLKGVRQRQQLDVALMADRLVACAEWAARQPETAGLPVGLFGSDTGGAAALLAASRRPELVSAVVCRGGRSCLTDEELGAVRAPALLMVSWSDGSAQSWDRNAQERLTCPKDLVAYTGRFQMSEDHRSMECVAEQAREWFDRYLTAGAQSAAPAK